jgi:pimeloyl-ACP methyl ester carboxylesterase
MMKQTSKLTIFCVLLSLAALAQDGAGSLKRRGYLGADLNAPSEGKPGAEVRRVTPGTAAAAMGLQVGDRITRINGQAMPDEITFERIHSQPRAGDTVRYQIVRGDQTLEKEATLPEMPREQIPGVQVTYNSVRSSKGQRLRTILSRPANARGRLPAVFLGAWLSCDSPDAPFGPHPRDGMAQLLRAIAKDSGFVLMRVEPPGRGDSEGVCVDTDFLTELEGYRAGFQALQRSEHVDPNRIFILGLSNGGGYAPLVHGDAKVAGYISFGGWSKTWFEHMMEIERRRLALDGVTPGEITKRLQGYAEFYTDYLVHKQTPGEIARRKPHLKDLWYDLPEHQYGRPAAFYHNLQDLNLWAAWEKAEAPVLAIWGEHDWIMSREDIEKLAEIANRKRPGSGRFVALPRTTHGLMQNNTDEFSHKNFGTGSFNQAVVPLVFEWMKGIVSKQ